VTDAQDRDKDRRFTQDEVGELVELAGRLDEHSTDLSMESLTEVAAEMGVTESALQEAIAERDEKAIADAAVDEPDPKTTRAELVKEFRRQLQAFITTGFIVVAIDFLTTGGFTWSRWPLFGIGIGVVAAGAKLVGPADDE
jgi:hypothetical protein